MKRELDLSTLRLSSGAHAEGSGEFCVNEAAAYIAGEPWSYRPRCVSPAITAYTIVLDDAPGAFGKEARRRLVAYIPRMIGTRGTLADEVERAKIAAEWAAKSAATYAAESAAKQAAEYAAKSAAKQAAEYAARWAVGAAKWAAKSAAESAEWAEWAAESAKWAEILDGCFACLDAMIAVGK